MAALIRRHRLLFLLALYLGYLAVLYGVVGVREPAGHGSRIVARLALPAVELGLCGLLCATCLRMARHGARAAWLALAWAIAAIATAVYFAQIVSMVMSGNFISALAMENADSAGFVLSPVVLAAALPALAAWLLFCVASWRASRRPQLAAGAERWHALPLAAGTCALALLFVYALFLQGKNQRLEPGFRQSPMVNLAVNLWHSQDEVLQDSANPVATVDASQCFPFADGEAAPYPFRRKHAYSSPLPVPARDGAGQRPNVIVIFGEGISARMIGAYGGKYPGLTPNLDALAARSMQVQDYFNHTAATFRGLAGQLSSGYSYAGGGGKEGWNEPGNQAGLLRIRRQTLPLVFRGAGYQSYFFAPHRSGRPLITMLRALGFDEVFNSESLQAELLDGHGVGRKGTSALNDRSLFQGLIAFLQARADDGDATPFFAATYNIGTHAFLGSAPHGVPYESGHGQPELDKLHNFDAALGEFLRYFRGSRYAANTILVVTADHATYPAPAYREVAGEGLKPYFVDRIPLFVLDPIHRLPRTLDAAGRNSLALAPTVLQLAGVQTRANAFLGNSLFEARRSPVGITAMASNYYMTTPDGVFAASEVPPGLRADFNCGVDVVRRFYAAERDNRIFPDIGAFARSAAR